MLIDVCMYVCVYVCMCVYVCVYVWIWQAGSAVSVVYVHIRIYEEILGVVSDSLVTRTHQHIII